jgi:hypothetical protein
MTAGSITSIVNGVADDGTIIPLDDQGLLRLRPGDTIAITTTGWKPDSPTEIRAHSTPTRLGTLHADANGTTTGTVTLPDTIEVGQHRLVIDGITIGDDRATIAIALHIAGPPSLWSGIPIWIPINLAIALALAVPTRWQRGRETASQS